MEINKINHLISGFNEQQIELNSKIKLEIEKPSYFRKGESQ